MLMIPRLMLALAAGFLLPPPETKSIAGIETGKATVEGGSQQEGNKLHGRLF